MFFLNIIRTVNIYRSSDSTKYSTNKSSGASVTSNGHIKTGHLSSSTTQLHSVSSRKPPLHPSRHFSKINNTATAPVHNSNNRLINNCTVFQNNQYTFSLSRISGNGVGLSPNGYLEARPLSSASIHGDGSIRVSRGTKSDIGVPVSRQSSSKIFLANQRAQNQKSQQLSNNSYLSSLNTSTNNSCSKNFLPSINGGYCNTIDYLENYKTASLKNYNVNNNNACIKHKQRINSNNQNMTTNVGPLLYLENDRRNLSNAQFHATRNVSKILQK